MANIGAALRIPRLMLVRTYSARDFIRLFLSGPTQMAHLNGRLKTGHRVPPPHKHSHGKGMTPRIQQHCSSTLRMHVDFI